MATFREINEGADTTVPDNSDLMERLEGLEDQNSHLQETLTLLNSMIDRNWYSTLGGYDDRQGPTLEQIKTVSARNRELMALNPHVGNGLELIDAYVWGDGIHYDGIPGKRQGRGANIQELIDDPINQENFFGQLARKQRQTAFYCDGMAFYSGEINDGRKTIVPVSIQSIDDDYRNPENDDEIWAYRRSWKKRKPNNQPPEDKHEWIFVARHADKRGSSATLEYHGQREKIATNKVLFVKKSNPVVGWAYGLSDVQRGISWAEDYRIAMLDGKSMNASLASIWAQHKNNSVAGASAAAVTSGNMTGAGGLAHIGQNNSLQVLPTAGQAYDFAKLLPLLANFAAGIGVSVVALSMNSGNAGGSYGAAKALDRPEQLSTKKRREYNIELDREVLIWLGAPADKLDIWFDPIIDLTEKYRGEQITELRLGTGAYEGDEIKRMHAISDGKDPDKIKPVPKGWLQPNNESKLEAEARIAAAHAPNPANGGDFAPTQGSGAKTNKSGSGDQKSDDIRGSRESRLQAILDDVKADELIELLKVLNDNLRGVE